MILSATKQAILNMVYNNQCIPEFVKANICTYEYFKTDNHILQFVLDKYRKDGIVSVGDLILQFPDFTLCDLADLSTDIEGIIHIIRCDIMYNDFVNTVNNTLARYSGRGDTVQLMRHLYDYLDDQLSRIDPTKTYGIIENAQHRFETYQTKAAKKDRFIPTGFAEIDNLIGGWSRDDGELASFLARMGMGKTWILLQSCTAAWAAGFKCGILSIEMTPESIGTRIDTLLSHLPNIALRRGQAVDMTVYQNYLAEMRTKDLSTDIEVRRKRDFDGHITPTGIENWIRESQLDVLYLDGIGYVESERFNTRNKSESSITTDVSEDLMSISGDLHCPIILTQQANRGGADRSINPGLDNARGSDGVNINASFVASIAHPSAERKELIRLEVLKSRYSRSGLKFDYNWDPNIGIMQYEGEVTASNEKSQAFFGNNQ